MIPIGSYLGFARAHPILHRNKEGNLKKKKKKYNGYSIYTWCVALTDDPLPKLLKLSFCGHIWTLHGRTLFYIETKKEIF